MPGKGLMVPLKTTKNLTTPRGLKPISISELHLTPDLYKSSEGLKSKQEGENPQQDFKAGAPPIDADGDAQVDKKPGSDQPRIGNRQSITHHGEDHDDGIEKEVEHPRPQAGISSMYHRYGGQRYHDLVRRSVGKRALVRTSSGGSGQWAVESIEDDVSEEGHESGKLESPKEKRAKR